VPGEQYWSVSVIFHDSVEPVIEAAIEAPESIPV
jgi:hypothetical protein